MRNPYKDLSKPKPVEPVDEEVAGYFECQHEKCYTVVERAYYNKQKKTVSWECPEGHGNNVEGVVVDD